MGLASENVKERGGGSGVRPSGVARCGEAAMPAAVSDVRAVARVEGPFIRPCTPDVRIGPSRLLVAGCAPSGTGAAACGAARVAPSGGFEGLGWECF